MDRYSLAWAGLGALGLAASVTWWLTSVDGFDTALTPLPSSPPTGATSTVSGLWQAPGATERGAMAAGADSRSVVGSSGRDGPSSASDMTPSADVLTHGFVSASLQALSANGVRLSLPQVSLHTVQTVDLSAAQALSRWARSQGFSVRPPVKVLEHGGEVNWVLPIERHGVLEVAQIVADGQHIRERARQTPGARYHTWQVPVDGRSTLAGAAQS